MNFRTLIDYLKHHRDFALLAGAVLLLLVALLRPTVNIRRDIYTYMLVVDITQSMNVEDMKLDGKPVSRLAYTRHMLRDEVANMPCGTRVSIALFAGASAALLYSPIEVCQNYDVIQDTIAHLEWRQAWSGNSRLRHGAQAIAHLLTIMREPARVVFFTDGEEAPRLHAFNTLDLAGFQGGQGWLVVGIGGEQGTPIPKLDENDKLLGFWSADSMRMQPGVAQISQENIGARNDDVAASDNDRVYSKLDEEYLKKYTAEIGGAYVRGDNAVNVQLAMNKLKPARHDVAPVEINRLLAGLAGLLLLFAYLGKHPWQLLQRLLHRRAAQR
jgi:mxaL protein